MYPPPGHLQHHPFFFRSAVRCLIPFICLVESPNAATNSSSKILWMEVTRSLLDIWQLIQWLCLKVLHWKLWITPEEAWEGVAMLTGPVAETENQRGPGSFYLWPLNILSGSKWLVLSYKIWYSCIATHQNHYVPISNIYSMYAQK